MNYKGSVKSIFLFVIIALIIMATLVCWVISEAEKSRYQIPVLGQLPEFKFTDQDGRPFGLSDMKGKITVMDFIFTRCQGPCPVMASHFSRLYQLYHGSDIVQLLSISVDPDYDTDSVLKAYADRHGVTDNRWIFLRAPLDSIVAFSEQGLMIAADRESLPGGHSTRFTLIDSEGRIRGYYDGLDDAAITRLKNNINRLVGEIK